MDQFIYQIIIPALAGLLSGFTGWIFGRRKTNAEAKGVEIGNLDKIATMWENSAKQFHQGYQEIYGQMEKLRVENGILVEEVRGLRAEVKELQCENKRLLRRLNEIKKYQQYHDNENQ